MRALLTGAAALAALYGLYLTGLYLFQRRIVFLTDKARPDLTRVALPRTEAVTVTTEDGLPLLAWYMPPQRADGYVVLFLHGNAGNIGHRGYRLERFDRLGWGALLLEYRGFGGNPGHPSENGLLTDARAGLAKLRAMGIPLDRILVWGKSLGTGPAVRLATEQRVAALLLEAPYTSVADLARLRFPLVPVDMLLLDRFDSLRAIGRVQAPVLVMHGERDRIVPAAQGRAMFEAAPSPKELWIARDTGHFGMVDAGAIEAAADFVKRLERDADSGTSGSDTFRSGTSGRCAL
jgi:fermentation-respiration switch protein FrsA (DUF1100 family)